MTKKMFRNRDNDKLYEVWGEVDNCSDDVEWEDKKMIVYSYAGEESPQFARTAVEFHREFVRDERLQLFKFYGVDTLEALVNEQARHIERLQAQLPLNVAPAMVRVREG